MNKKLRIYLNKARKPLVFKLSEEKYIKILDLIDEAKSEEIITIENISFVKREFCYAEYR